MNGSVATLWGAKGRPSTATSQLRLAFRVARDVVLMKRRARRSLEASLWDSSGTHVASFPNKNPRFTGVLGADDGTRTHDLLHGKCERPFAPVRAGALKPPVCRAFPPTERTRANPSERRTLPSLPQSRARWHCAEQRPLPMTGRAARRAGGQLPTHPASRCLSKHALTGRSPTTKSTATRCSR